MSTTSAAVQAPPAGRYAIDRAGSSVTFVTKHMFGLGKVRGGLKVTRGVITIADPPEDSRVEAEVSASRFSTRNLMRGSPGPFPTVPPRPPSSGDLVPLRQHPDSTREAGRLPGSSR